MTMNDIDFYFNFMFSFCYYLLTIFDRLFCVVINKNFNGISLFSKFNHFFYFIYTILHSHCMIWHLNLNNLVLGTSLLFILKKRMTSWYLALKSYKIKFYTYVKKKNETKMAFVRGKLYIMSGSREIFFVKSNLIWNLKWRWPTWSEWNGFDIKFMVFALEIFFFSFSKSFLRNSQKL